VTSKGRHFNSLFGLEKDVDQPKPTPDDATVSKQSFNLEGVRIGHHIEIFWNPAEEEVADAPTHEVGKVAVSMEAVQDLQGLFIDHLSGDKVFRPGDNERVISLCFVF